MDQWDYKEDFMLQEDSRMEDERGGSEAPPPNGRIRVKLKFPRMVPEGEEEEEDAAAEAEAEIGLGEEIKTHYCKECNRGFSSGKALGGHMSSAHVQANKDQSLKKLKSRTKSQDKGSGSGSGSGSASGSAVENSCVLCGRGFQSKKSLYGHMRCHPEREWRGMAPPKMEFTEGSSEPEFEDIGPNQEYGDYDQIDSGPKEAPMADLDGNLKGWSRRAKRGRGPLKPVSDSLSFPQDEEVIVAVHQLIRLLETKRNVEEVEDMGSNSSAPPGPELEIDHSKKQKLDCPEPELEFKKPENKSSLEIHERNDQATGHDHPVRSNNDKGKEKTDCDSDNEINITAMNELKNNNEARDDDDEGAKHPTDTDQENVEKTMPIEPKCTSVKYLCETCFKTFPTHQALGGHRSSHIKFKMSIYNTMDRQQRRPDVIRTRAVTNNIGATSAGEQHGTPVINDHACNICDKTFPSGQALGGHKRCHSAADESVRAEEKVPLGFDLNEMPDDEDDQDSRSDHQSKDADGDL